MIGKNAFTRVVVITAIVAGGCLGVAALIGLAAGGFAPRVFRRAGATVDERASLPLGGVDLVALTTVAENMHIIDGAGDSVEAWLHGTAGAGSHDAVPHLVAKRAGSTADIRVERKRPAIIGPFWSNLTLEVSLPKGYASRLSAKSISANINVADHAYAGLDLSTTSGEIRVGAVSASDFAMHSTSGGLRATAVTSQRVDVSSVSGDVDVKSLTGDTTVHTVSGEVKVAFAAAPSRLEAASTSGDVTLRLPQDAQFILDARSTSGDISCKFPITISERSTGGGRHVLAGAVGSGPKAVAVRTVSGEIRIER
jgi:lia operon protein LiaG